MKKKPVWHPYLFALSPILFIYSRNPFEIPMRELLIPVLLSFCLAFFLCRLQSRALKDSGEAPVMASVFMLMFFSYGYLRPGLHGMSMKGFELGRDRILMALWTLGLSGILGIMHKLKKQAATLNRFLNASSFFLLLVTVFHLGINSSLYFTNNRAFNPSQGPERNPPSDSSKIPSTLPDIYYIILDGYARQDVLKSLYHYDNTPFLEWLKEKGFYIAENSSSNYSQTVVSIPSSLNFDYLDKIAGRLGAKSRDTRPLREMIRHSQLAEILKSKGYKTMNFASGWYFTEIQNSGIYQTMGWNLSEFHHALLNMTPLPVFYEKIFSLKLQYNFHRKQVLYTLDHLAARPDVPDSLFVFVHIIAPHPPFVFDEKGGFVESNRVFSFDDGNLYTGTSGQPEYIEKYPRQLAFISKRIQGVIEKILSRPGPKPILILQGDHGPGSGLNWDNPERSDLHERMSIFNAYYFPDQNYAELYPGISPVNSFRVVLNRYFGFSYERLKDRHFFSGWRYPYDFKDVTGET